MNKNTKKLTLLVPHEWHADDGHCEITVKCNSGEAAAQEYVSGGDWGDVDTTIWIRVHVWQSATTATGIIVRANEETWRVALDPDEPTCTSEKGHNWRSPHEIVGGLENNPGVWGNGGGVKIYECCTRCGCERLTDTWAQDRDTGEQGLEAVSYTPRKYAAKLGLEPVEE